jgi:hypothetical protein
VNAIFDTAASLGDVNGDGYLDFSIGVGALGRTRAVHVYLGSAAPGVATWNGDSPAARIDLSPRPTATAAGSSSSPAREDVNGDGFADLLVGASGVAGAVGLAHLYLGARDPAPAWHAGSPRRGSI